MTGEKLKDEEDNSQLSPGALHLKGRRGETGLRVDLRSPVRENRTQVYTDFSIRQLKKVHAMTHPAAGNIFDETNK